MNIVSEFLNKNYDIYHDSVMGNEKELFKQAEKNALNLFQQASVRVPAYKDFLKKRKINPLIIRSITDLNKIETTTKENYIHKYEINDRSWDGKLEKSSMISSSSGTTGSPIFWPRNIEVEVDGAFMHQYLFEKILKIKHNKTLFVNGFALGNWIAGTFTHSSVYLLSLKGFPITIATPGYSMEDMISVIANLGGNFRNIVIAGHVPFLKDIAEELNNLRLNFTNTNVFLLGAGQGITENWRGYVNQLIKDIAKSSMIINLYGSADAALMGFENDITINLRKKLYLSQRLNMEIFNDERVPSLYVFDPRSIYFQSDNSELVITKNYGCPLIRYNIHDQGGIISYTDLNKILSTSGLKKIVNTTKDKLPFIYLFGREKFMVKIFGANIYTEHVQNALNHNKLQNHLTGNFKMEIEFDSVQNPLLVLRAELKSEVNETGEINQLVSQIFISEVGRQNSEYRFLIKSLKEKVMPKIILHKYGHEKYFPKNKIIKNS